MRSVSSFKKIHVYCQFVDMRKSISGLSAIVDTEDSLDVFSGDLFVFCSRSRKILKAIYWDDSGFALWNKKLDKSFFKWPSGRDGKVLLFKSRLLELLLAGADVTRKHKKLSYSRVI